MKEWRFTKNLKPNAYFRKVHLLPMLNIVLLGVLIVVCNVVIQAISNLYFLKIFIPQFKRWKGKHETLTSIGMLIFLVMFFTLLHAGQCTLCAMVYYLNPAITSLSSFSEAIYFSLITFTTIGYGDVVIDSEWRLLSGIEAINGIMLVGWSTAMIFAFIQVIYSNLRIMPKHDHAQ